MNGYVSKALKERRAELSFSASLCKKEATCYNNEIARLQGRIAELKMELDDINATRAEYIDAIDEINSLLGEEA